MSARRVIYRSWWARAARVGVGLLLVGIALWQALPVIGGEHGPPPPVALYVGFNTSEYPPPRESTLYVTVHDDNCRNPATVKGLLERPQRSWRADQRWAERNRAALKPTEAEIVLADAEVTEAKAGLAVLGALKSPLLGWFESPIVSGEETVSLESGRKVTAHNHVRYLLHPYHPPGFPALGAVVLSAPQWPVLRSPLHFILRADLIRPLGFHRCYVDVPALLSSGGGIDNKPLLEAYGYTFHEPIEEGLIHPALGEPPVEEPGFRDIGETRRAEITVFVSGHVVDGASVGSGATDVPNGVHFVCTTREGVIPAAVNSTCAGTPAFEVPGREDEITRRVFVAGIFGAIGVTLIIEALFVGETVTRHDARRAS